MKRRRRVAFLALVAMTTVSILAVAQPKKPVTPAKPPVTAPAKKPPGKPAPSGDVDASVAMSTKEEKAPAGAAKDAGVVEKGSVVESKTADGGAKVFRFGEVEVEGRLKSPQIVYFLRRVRAEFAAGDLGHRSFMRELSDTRNDQQF